MNGVIPIFYYLRSALIYFDLPCIIPPSDCFKTCKVFIAQGGIMDDVFEKNGKLSLGLFSSNAQAVLEESIKLGVATHSDHIRTSHLFMGLIAFPDPGIVDWGQSLKADLKQLLMQFQELFHQEKAPEHPKLFLHREFLSDQVIALIREAKDRCLTHARKSIHPMDLLITLLNDSESVVVDCFQRIGITAAKLTEYAVLAESRCYTSGESGLDAA